MEFWTSWDKLKCQRCPYFFISGNWNRAGSTTRRGVLISGDWVLLYTEVSSFQGVRIEGFHCMYIEVSRGWNIGPIYNNNTQSHFPSLQINN